MSASARLGLPRPAVVLVREQDAQYGRARTAQHVQAGGVQADEISLNEIGRRAGVPQANSLLEIAGDDIINIGVAPRAVENYR